MDSTGGTPAIADATAAGEVRAKVAARMAMAREARRLAEDVRPRWAAIVAGMYFAVALGAAALGATTHRWMGPYLPIAIAGYAGALGAGAWRLRVGRDRDPRAFAPLSGAFAHALLGLWGVLAMHVDPRGRSEWASLFGLLAFFAMAYGTIPLSITAICTRRGGWLLAASLLGPALLCLDLGVIPGTVFKH